MNRFLAVGLIVSNITLLNASPVRAQGMVVETPECVDAISSVESQLKSDRNLTIESSQINDRNAFGTPPEGRPHQYAFGMGGSAVEGVMSSPVFLNSLATQVINNCNSISSVSFGLWQSGLVSVYGLLPSGEVEPFKCPEDYEFNPDTDRDLVWGEYCAY